MTARLPLAGRVFGRLTVVSLHSVGAYTRWNCRCQCGNVNVVRASHLIAGRVKSCGCGSTRGRPVKAKTAPSPAWRELADAMRRVPAVKVP